jgi:hypothetical protein
MYGLYAVHTAMSTYQDQMEGLASVVHDQLRLSCLAASWLRGMKYNKENDVLEKSGKRLRQMP